MSQNLWKKLKTYILRIHTNTSQRRLNIIVGADDAADDDDDNDDDGTHLVHFKLYDGKLHSFRKFAFYRAGVFKAALGRAGYAVVLRVFSEPQRV